MTKTDVVVIGAGAAGIGAAITLAEASKNVILLEKGNRYGGAGMFGAQGLFAVNSQQQQATNSSLTLAQAYQEMMAYTHYRSNAPLTKAILSKSADTIDWLADHGLATELVNNTQEVHQDRPRVYHQYIDKFAGFERLMQHFLDHGGILKTETAAKSLKYDGQQVTGVVVEHDGHETLINCQAVIVADGGYIGNPEMVKQYLDIDAKNLFSMGERKATGDGISMLAGLGADTKSLGTFENHAASVVSDSDPKWHNDTIFTLTNLPLLWVNATGKRFVDEGIVYDFALWGNTTYQAGGYYYFVIDQYLVDQLKTSALPLTHSFERTFTTLAHQEVTHHVGPFTEIDADLAQAVEKGAAFKGDTLAELSAQLHVSAGQLTATVARYNDLVQRGHDEDFYKADNFMNYPVRQGPFYAIKARSTSLGTIGGIETNEKLEALKSNAHPIKGAFVAGNNASGMYDTSYPTIEGISCAFAWNSGRIAGESASHLIETGTQNYYEA